MQPADIFCEHENYVGFRDSFSMLMSDYSQEEKIFFIETYLFGQVFLSQYKVDSQKDICFTLTLNGNIDSRGHILKLPISEVIKLNNRDFGESDRKLTSSVIGRPYATPPYPLIELFKKTSIQKIVPLNTKGETQQLEMDQPTTNKYHFFLKNFQFPIGDESKVEDVYAKYLNMSKEVYQCILEDDLQCITGYKKMGFNLDSYPSDNEPILTVSVRANKSKITTLLLRSGANPNVTDSNGTTPLMVAAVKGNLDFVKLLVKYGANPNIKSSKGFLALDFAKSEKLEKIVSYLSPITTVIGVSERLASTSSRNGEFNMHPNQPERHSYYTSWGASCASGGFAFVNINDDSRNIYCRGGSNSPGGCDVGIGVEAALAKACRGE